MVRPSETRRVGQDSGYKKVNIKNKAHIKICRKPMLYFTKCASGRKSEPIFFIAVRRHHCPKTAPCVLCAGGHLSKRSNLTTTLPCGLAHDKGKCFVECVFNIKYFYSQFQLAAKCCRTNSQSSCNFLCVQTASKLDWYTACLNSPTVIGL